MPLSRIKGEYLSKQIGFGKSRQPLGRRDDIDDLAITALESQDKTLVELFEFLPTLESLKKAKTDKELGRDK